MTELSPMERNVAELIAAGKEPQEMADILLISKKTVASYRDRIKHKTKVRNNVELCLWWQKNGVPFR